MKILTLILSVFLCTELGAQTPGFDVYIADLKVAENGVLAIANIKALTNRPEYDNQPHFLPDGDSLLISSAINTAEQEQIDSFIYHLSTDKSANLTKSEISEYSPTLMPNGQDFSVIRGIGDIQKLWRYPLDVNNGKAPSELLKNVNPVGYHAWIDPSRVILFVLGDPHTLQLADVSKQSSTVIDSDIGASLFKIPGTELMSYSAAVGDTNSEDEQTSWDLKSYNPATGEIKVLSQLPDSAYYYGWSADGKALAAVGTVLKQWDLSQPNKGWVDFADVSQSCSGGVTRLTTNQQNTKLAFVCTR
jgi:Tol biopolymer transport system component